jgi:PhnB protein
MMDTSVNPVPKGFSTVSPILVIRGASEALTFYRKAFGAKVLGQMDRPDGKLMHAMIKIGDSVMMLGEECAPHESHHECVRSPADLKGTTISLYVYVSDADSVFQQAVDAGAHQIMAVSDTFWGDRMGMVRDPYGHVWSVATHVEDPTEEQIRQRTQALFSQKH